MFQAMDYIYEVYKTRSFSRAAKNLFVSQPALSATVKRTEQRIGYPIFDRSTKPLGITECGEHYIRAIEKIMATEKDFENYVNDLGELKTGRLILGGSNLFSSLILPPLIGRFGQHYPNIKVELMEESTAKLAEFVQSGTIDLVLDNCPVDSDIFDHAVLFQEHLLLAVPKSFPVNRELESLQIPVTEIQSGGYLNCSIPAVPLRCFTEFPFILLKQENDTREQAMRICQEQNFSPHVILELDQQMTSYNITSSGMGISFISDTLISRVPAHENIIYYKLKEEDIGRDVSFYWKKGRYMSLAMKKFLELSPDAG